ncbi:MAG: hypothetical protein IPP63_19080 [Chloracidobacterium sp.]|nr:hypothetical protein [Chloracidobacterium sp.]
MLQAAKSVGLQALPSKVLLFLLPLWIIFQSVLSIGGFYENTDTLPPRLLFLHSAGLGFESHVSALFRPTFAEKLPLELLTLVHVVRIPVEFVLYWLF